MRALLAGSTLALVVVLGACAGRPISPEVAAAQTLTEAPSATPRPATPTATRTAMPTPSPTMTPAPTLLPLTIEVRLSSSSITQGETIEIDVACNQPCQASAQLADQTIRMFSPAEDRAWAALAAHALAEPGQRTLRIEAATVSGQRAALVAPVSVQEGSFTSELLTFDANTALLLDPAISDAENIRMDQVFGLYSPQMLWEGPLVWPWEGYITSEFGTRRVYQDVVQSFHTGIDIDGETGDAILACARGVVVLAEPLQVRGNAVVINHGAGVLSGYYHLDEIEVSAGQIVQAGEQIGLMGSTGLSTGSHLHWEVRVGGVAANPRQWADQPMGPMKEIEP